MIRYPWWVLLTWHARFRFPDIHGRPAFERAPPAGGTRDGPVARIVLGGDIMVKQGDRLPEVHEDLQALVREADLFVATLEAPLAEVPLDHERNYRFVVQMPRLFLLDLLDRLGARPDRTVLSVATNHAADDGPEGFERTLQILRDQGLRTAGVLDGDHPFTQIQLGDLRVGLVAWTAWMNQERFSPPGTGVIRDGHVSGIDWSALKRSAQLDTLIGTPHWGYEFHLEPPNKARRLAHACLSAGFDAICGSHTHLMQPIERIGEGICAYSLGNLTFAMLERCAGQDSWALTSGLFLELGVSTAPESLGKIAYYQLHPFIEEPCHGGSRITPLARSRSPHRRRVEALFNRVYPSSTPPASTAAAEQSDRACLYPFKGNLLNALGFNP